MVSLEPALLALAGRIGRAGCSASLSTSELGGILGVSQQSASRYLALLEERGWIERARRGRAFEVKVTPDGLGVLRGIHGSLGVFLDSAIKQSFEGVVASGIGEGAYYVGEYSGKIDEAVGYRPFPGTLNVRFAGEKPNMNSPNTIDILGFTSGGRSFGRVGLTPIRLSANGKTVDCHVIIPERTHHRRDVEIVSGNNLRRKLDLSDGDRALITFI
jgi:riboflavin kinase, archaea type